MNYERILDEIPEVFQATGDTKELELLNSLLGWTRNEAFGRVAETCALWGALVHANAHLNKLEALLTSRNVDHERFSLPPAIDMELEGSRNLMQNLPGGRHLLTIKGEPELALAIQRLHYLREYNTYSR